MQRWNEHSKIYTAWLALLTFTLTSLISIPNVHAEPTVSSAAAFRKFSSLLLPPDLAKVEMLKTGGAHEGPSVIVIQDAHSIPAAQRSIRKIILYLEKNYGVNQVGVEGASDDLDTRIFQSYPDQKRLQSVFKEYMDKGEMTGSVTSAIFGLKNEITGTTVHFFGVEDWRIYEEGLALYLKAMGQEEKINKQLEVRSGKLEEEKRKAYSKELLDVDQAQIDFEGNSKDLLTYLKALAAVKAPEAGSEIALLLNEADKGAADESALDSEVRRHAARLKKNLVRLSAEGQKVFSEQFQSFQTSQISAAQFALVLKDLSGKEGFKLTMSRGMAHQAFNQRRMRDLEGTKLFKDIETYVQVIKESLFRNNIERQLDQQTRELILLKKWAKLELSREDWGEVKKMLEVRSWKLEEKRKVGGQNATTGREITGVAEEHGIDKRGVSSDEGVPKRGNIWGDEPDSQSGRIDSLQYRGGERPTVQEGVPAVSAFVQGVSLRGANFDQNLNRAGVSSSQRGDSSSRAEQRGHSNVERTHSIDVVILPTSNFQLLTLFKYHRAFYENAEKRDEAFIRNLEKRLKPRETAIMIAGGFHAQGLARHLEERGVDFALVMPNIEKLPDVSAYREHMKGNVDWKSYFEVKNGKINLYDAFVRYTRDRLLKLEVGSGKLEEGNAISSNPMLLKNWRDQMIRNLADEGKLAKAGEYTRFIDETLQDKKKKDLESRRQDVEKFIAGLKDLDAKGQFTAPNIAKLFQRGQGITPYGKAATIEALAKAPGIAQPGLNVSADVFEIAGDLSFAGELESAVRGAAKSEVRSSEPFYFGLKLMMDEMVSNAAKVTEKDKQLTVKINKVDGGFEIIIDDGGPGWDIPQLREVAKAYYKLYDGFPEEDTDNYGFMEKLQLEGEDNEFIAEGKKKTWVSVVREIVNDNREDWEIFHELLAYKPVAVGFTGRSDIQGDVDIPGPYTTLHLSRDGLNVAGGRGWFLSNYYAGKFQGTYQTFNRPADGIGMRVRFWFPATITIRQEGLPDEQVDILSQFDKVAEQVSLQVEAIAVGKGVPFQVRVGRSEVRNQGENVVELVHEKPGYDNDGAGKLTLTINKGEPVVVRLNSQYLEPHDLEMLKGLLVAAGNQDEINATIEKLRFAVSQTRGGQKVDLSALTRSEVRGASLSENERLAANRLQTAPFDKPKEPGFEVFRSGLVAGANDSVKLTKVSKGRGNLMGTDTFTVELRSSAAAQPVTVSVSSGYTSDATLPFSLAIKLFVKLAALTEAGRMTDAVALMDKVNTMLQTATPNNPAPVLNSIIAELDKVAVPTVTNFKFLDVKTARSEVRLSQLNLPTKVHYDPSYSEEQISELDRKRQTTMDAIQQFPFSQTLSVIVMATTADGNLIFTERGGKLALVERYILAGEKLEAAAEAAFSDANIDLARAPISFTEGAGYVSDPKRVENEYRDSVIIQAKLSGDLNGLQSINPADVELDKVLPEHRSIVERYLRGEDLTQLDVHERSELVPDELKAARTQAIHAELRKFGVSVPGVAADAMIMVYDKTGQFKGLVLIERGRDIGYGKFKHLATPGGFKRQNESVVANMIREATKEEVMGVGTVTNPRVLKISADPLRDPNAVTVSPQIIVRATPEQELTADDDASGVYVVASRKDFEKAVAKKLYAALRTENAQAVGVTESVNFVRRIGQRGTKTLEERQRFSRFIQTRRSEKKFAGIWADHFDNVTSFWDEFESGALSVPATSAVNRRSEVRSIENQTLNDVLAMSENLFDAAQNQVLDPNNDDAQKMLGVLGYLAEFREQFTLGEFDSEEQLLKIVVFQIQDLNEIRGDLESMAADDVTLAQEVGFFYESLANLKSTVARSEVRRKYSDTVEKVKNIFKSVEKQPAERGYYRLEDLHGDQYFDSAAYVAAAIRKTALSWKYTLSPIEQNYAPIQDELEQMDRIASELEGVGEIDKEFRFSGGQSHATLEGLTQILAYKDEINSWEEPLPSGMALVNGLPAADLAAAFEKLVAARITEARYSSDEMLESVAVALITKNSDFSEAFLKVLPSLIELADRKPYGDGQALKQFIEFAPAHVLPDIQKEIQNFFSRKGTEPSDFFDFHILQPLADRGSRKAALTNLAKQWLQENPSPKAPDSLPEKLIGAAVRDKNYAMLYDLGTTYPAYAPFIFNVMVEIGLEPFSFISQPSFRTQIEGNPKLRSFFQSDKVRDIGKLQFARVPDSSGPSIGALIAWINELQSDALKTASGALLNQETLDFIFQRIQGGLAASASAYIRYETNADIVKSHFLAALYVLKRAYEGNPLSSVELRDVLELAQNGKYENSDLAIKKVILEERPDSHKENWQVTNKLTGEEMPLFLHWQLTYDEEQHMHSVSRTDYMVHNILKDQSVALSFIKGYLTARSEVRAGLFSDSAEVQQLMESIRTDWKEIAAKGAFVFDVDQTLLRKDADIYTTLADPENRELLEVFMKMLKMGVRIAVISGNSESVHMRRVFEPLKAAMAAELGALKNITFYFSGGARKLTFDQLGVAALDASYNQSQLISFESLSVFQSALKEAAQAKFYLTPEQIAQWAGIAAKAKYGKIRFDMSWAQGNSEWSPTVLTEQEWEQAVQSGADVSWPAIQIRGVEQTAQGARLGSFTVKPTPVFEIAGLDGKATKIDIRGKLQDLFRVRLGTTALKLRSGGTNSTDVTASDKAIALRDFIQSNRLDPKRIFYFGDEFYPNGNDEVIARAEDLSEVTTLSVGDETDEHSRVKLQIGDSYQATAQFLAAIMRSEIRSWVVPVVFGAWALVAFFAPGYLIHAFFATMLGFFAWISARLITKEPEKRENLATPYRYNKPGDPHPAEPDSSGTAKALAEKLKPYLSAADLVTAYANSTPLGMRDNFIFIELFMVRSVADAAKAIGALEKLGDENIANASGEAVIRRLYAQGALEYVVGSGVAASAVHAKAPIASPAAPRMQPIPSVVRPSPAAVSSTETPVESAIRRITQAIKASDFGYPFQDDPDLRKSLIEKIHEDIGDVLFRDALLKMLEDNYDAAGRAGLSAIMGILSWVHLKPLFTEHPELLDNPTRETLGQLVQKYPELERYVAVRSEVRNALDLAGVEAQVKSLEARAGNLKNLMNKFPEGDSRRKGLMPVVESASNELAAWKVYHEKLAAFAPARNEGVDLAKLFVNIGNRPLVLERLQAAGLGARTKEDPLQDHFSYGLAPDFDGKDEIGYGWSSFKTWVVKTRLMFETSSSFGLKFNASGSVVTFYARGNNGELLDEWTLGRLENIDGIILNREKPDSLNYKLTVNLKDFSAAVRHLEELTIFLTRKLDKKSNPQIVLDRQRRFFFVTQGDHRVVVRQASDPVSVELFDTKAQATAAELEAEYAKLPKPARSEVRIVNVSEITPEILEAVKRDVNGKTFEASFGDLSYARDKGADPFNFLFPQYVPKELLRVLMNHPDYEFTLPQIETLVKELTPQLGLGVIPTESEANDTLYGSVTFRFDRADVAVREGFYRPDLFWLQDHQQRNGLTMPPEELAVLNAMIEALRKQKSVNQISLESSETESGIKSEPFFLERAKYLVSRYGDDFDYTSPRSVKALEDEIIRHLPDFKAEDVEDISKYLTVKSGYDTSRRGTGWKVELRGESTDEGVKRLKGILDFAINLIEKTEALPATDSRRTDLAMHLKNARVTFTYDLFAEAIESFDAASEIARQIFDEMSKGTISSASQNLKFFLENLEKIVAQMRPAFESQIQAVKETAVQLEVESKNRARAVGNVDIETMKKILAGLPAESYRPYVDQEGRVVVLIRGGDLVKNLPSEGTLAQGLEPLIRLLSRQRRVTVFVLLTQARGVIYASDEDGHPLGFKPATLDQVRDQTAAMIMGLPDNDIVIEGLVEKGWPQFEAGSERRTVYRGSLTERLLKGGSFSDYAQSAVELTRSINFAGEDRYSDWGKIQATEPAVKRLTQIYEGVLSNAARDPAVARSEVRQAKRLTDDELLQKAGEYAGRFANEYDYATPSAAVLKALLIADPQVGSDNAEGVLSYLKVVTGYNNSYKRMGNAIRLTTERIPVIPEDSELVKLGGLVTFAINLAEAIKDADVGSEIKKTVTDNLKATQAALASKDESLAFEAFDRAQGIVNDLYGKSAASASSKELRNLYLFLETLAKIINKKRGEKTQAGGEATAEQRGEDRLKAEEDAGRIPVKYYVDWRAMARFSNDLPADKYLPFVNAQGLVSIMVKMSDLLAGEWKDSEDSELAKMMEGEWADAFMNLSQGLHIVHLRGESGYPLGYRPATAEQVRTQVTAIISAFPEVMRLIFSGLSMVGYPQFKSEFSEAGLRETIEGSHTDVFFRNGDLDQYVADVMQRIFRDNDKYTDRGITDAGSKAALRLGEIYSGILTNTVQSGTAELAARSEVRTVFEESFIGEDLGFGSLTRLDALEGVFPQTMTHDDKKNQDQQRVFERFIVRTQGRAAEKVLRRIQDHPELGLVSFTLSELESAIANGQVELAMPEYEVGADGKGVLMKGGRPQIKRTDAGPVIQQASVGILDNVPQIIASDAGRVNDEAKFIQQVVDSIKNPNLRFSFAGLVKWIVESKDESGQPVDKYILVVNKGALKKDAKKIKTGPLGGAVGGLSSETLEMLEKELGVDRKYFEAVDKELEAIRKANPSDPRSDEDIRAEAVKELTEKGQMDLRLTLKGTASDELKPRAKGLLEWFFKREGREINPLRELVEELQEEQGFLTEEEAADLLRSAKSEVRVYTQEEAAEFVRQFQDLKSRGGESKELVSDIVRAYHQFTQKGANPEADHWMRRFFETVKAEAQKGNAGLSLAETVAMTIAISESSDASEQPDFTAIAESGKVIHDVASTGGVGNILPTLVSLLVNAADDQGKLANAKIASDGGPGTIDTWESIPGVRTALTGQGMVETVTNTGMAVARQTAGLAPVDKAMMNLRRNTETMAVPALVIASILGKRISISKPGVVAPYVQVLVFSGETSKLAPKASLLNPSDPARATGLRQETIENTAFMAATAEQLQKLGYIRQFGAVVVDNDTPHSNRIGRGEFLEKIIRVLKGEEVTFKDGVFEGDPYALLAFDLAALSVTDLGLASDVNEAREMIYRGIKDGRALRMFEEVARAQSANPEELAAMVAQPEELEVYPAQIITAGDVFPEYFAQHAEGYIHLADVNGVQNLFKEIQGQNPKKGFDSANPSNLRFNRAGLHFLSNAEGADALMGQFKVTAQTPVFELRVPTDTGINAAQAAGKFLSIGQTALEAAVANSAVLAPSTNHPLIVKSFSGVRSEVRGGTPEVWTAEQIEKQLFAVQQFFPSKHDIQPLLKNAVSALKQGDYKKSFEVLEKAQTIAIREYNVYGLGGAEFYDFDRAKEMLLLMAQVRGLTQEKNYDGAWEALEQIQTIGGIEFFGADEFMEMVGVLNDVRQSAAEGDWAAVRERLQTVYDVTNYDLSDMPKAMDALYQVVMKKIKEVMDEGTAPMSLFYKPVSILQNARHSLAQLRAVGGEQILKPATRNELSLEAADIERRYNNQGVLDRYDPTVIFIEEQGSSGGTYHLALEGQIRREYEATGKAVPGYQEHIRKVMELLEIRGDRPQLKRDADIDWDALVDAEPQVSTRDQFVFGLKDVIVPMLSMTPAELTNHIIDSQADFKKLPKIESIDVEILHDIARLALAGDRFAGGDKETLSSRLKKLLKGALTEDQVGTILSMVVVENNGNIFMDLKGVQRAYEQAAAERRSEVRNADTEAVAKDAVKVIVSGQGDVDQVSIKLELAGKEGMSALLAALRKAAEDEIKRLQAQEPGQITATFTPQMAEAAIRKLDPLFKLIQQLDPGLLSVVFNVPGDEEAFSDAIAHGLNQLLAKVYTSSDASQTIKGVSVIKVNDLESFKGSPVDDNNGKRPVIGQLPENAEGLFASESAASYAGDPYKQMVDFYARTLFGLFVATKITKAEELKTETGRAKVRAALLDPKNLGASEISELVASGIFTLSDDGRLVTNSETLFSAIVAEFQARAQVGKAA